MSETPARLRCTTKTNLLTLPYSKFYPETKSNSLLELEKAMNYKTTQPLNYTTATFKTKRSHNTPSKGQKSLIGVSTSQDSSSPH